MPVVKSGLPQRSGVGSADTSCELPLPPPHCSPDEGTTALGVRRLLHEARRSHPCPSARPPVAQLVTPSSPKRSRTVSHREDESDRADGGGRTLQIGRTQKSAAAQIGLDRRDRYVGEPTYRPPWAAGLSGCKHGTSVWRGSRSSLARTQLEERPPWDLLLLRGAGRVGKACDALHLAAPGARLRDVDRWASGALG